jgi:ubiquinone/menaquinone biosynthesis C-methylase UbiE
MCEHETDVKSMTESSYAMWTDADAYEAYVGRWSRVAAVEFLDWLGVAPQSAWLDVGCGTGALAQTILRCHDPSRVDAFDLSPAFIEEAASKTNDSRATFRIADAGALPSADASFDAVVSGLMLNAAPDQPRALSEFVRTARQGGIVGVYVWDFDGEMQMLRRFWEAANSLDPEADRDRDVSGFAICKPDRLKEAFTEARLRDVEVRAIDAPTLFRDFDDYWKPFLRGPAPAPTHVRSLSEAKRTELRERIRAGLPIAADGSIPMIARAWAAKGIK